METEKATRVKAYIDGFNLYYGARKHCKRSTPGWRWLNVRSFIEGKMDSISQHFNLPDTSIHISYYTANVKPRGSKNSHIEQQVYLDALRHGGFVDEVVLGKYITRDSTGALASEKSKKVPYGWPVMVASDVEPFDHRREDLHYLAKILTFEEKGTDVNLATDLCWDVCEGKIDVAVVVSNDSDLVRPVHRSAEKIPVALVNPQTGNAAQGFRKGAPDNFYIVHCKDTDFRQNQLPETVTLANGKTKTKPTGW